jgi:hypothetical protein
MLAGGANWHAITFPSFAGSCGLHYKLVLTNNGNPIRMTVSQNCASTNVTCGGGEASTNYTTWEWTNSGAQCTQTYPTTFHVLVSTIGSAATCMDYTLSAFVQ